MNTKLRDEIFIQIVNQTWNNDNSESNSKAWQLMSNCLSCFSPSPFLFKYLLKYLKCLLSCVLRISISAAKITNNLQIIFFRLKRYCSDHAENGYKAYCQLKLLESEKIEPQLVRTYPPSLLESKACKNCAHTAVEANFIDGRRVC